MNFDSLGSKIAKQDENAFKELYEQSWKLVYSISFSILKDQFSAENIAQDTFVSVWEHAKDFRGKGFKTWMLTIARNKSLNLLKKNKHEFCVDFSENESLEGKYFVEENFEISIALKMAMEKLNELDRQIVFMKTSGLKMKEIAKILEMPRGTASWRYSEALKKLKRELEGAYEN